MQDPDYLPFRILRNLPMKRLPAIGDRALWERVTKGKRLEEDGIALSRKYGMV